MLPCCCLCKAHETTCSRAPHLFVGVSSIAKAIIIITAVPAPTAARITLKAGAGHCCGIHPPSASAGKFGSFPRWLDLFRTTSSSSLSVKSQVIGEKVEPAPLRQLAGSFYKQIFVQVAPRSVEYRNVAPSNLLRFPETAKDIGILPVL